MRVTVNVPDTYIDEFISACESKASDVGTIYFPYVRKVVGLFDNIEVKEPVKDEALGKLLGAMAVNEVMNRININNKTV